jgi:hypothetical protein
MSAAARGAAPDAMPFLLRRTGARPLRGFGRQLAAADSHADGCRFTLQLYGTEPDAYVAAMSCEPAHGPPWHDAQACATLDDALLAFETALPLTALPPALPICTAATALHQAARSVCLEAAVSHAFRNVVGVFLHRLCTHGVS